jgi:mannose-6-phosphate isomerase-like protein (cupin superfamily)
VHFLKLDTGQGTVAATVQRSTPDREVTMHGTGNNTGKLPHGSVHLLTGTVVIAPGAIVSRALMRTDGGNLTVFAFDRGQELAEHTAPFDAFVTVLEGGLRVVIDDVDHELAAGDAIVMPADVPHAVRAPVPAKWMLVMLKAVE